ncbi:MAG: hypothetical protein O3A20_04660 [Planctomycetota bacterium]|nr:hypothetical protein [Planctomycetota bacterium]
MSARRKPRAPHVAEPPVPAFGRNGTRSKRRKMALRLNLHFVFFDAPGNRGSTIGHCLDLDVCAEGATRQEASDELRLAIEEYLAFKLENHEFDSLLRRTPDGVVPAKVAGMEAWEVVALLELNDKQPAKVTVLFPTVLGGAHTHAIPGIQAFA